MLLKESGGGGGGGGGQPHIQEHHQSLANHMLADMGYLYCIKMALSDMWGIFFFIRVKTHAYFE